MSADQTPGRPTEQEWAEAREALILDVSRGFHEFTGGHPDYPLYDEVGCGGAPEHHCEAGHEHGSRGICWACEPPAAYIVDEVIRPLIAREREATKVEGAASVAGPVLALADRTESDAGSMDPFGDRWVLLTDLRAAIPTDATEALARLKAQWQAEVVGEVQAALCDERRSDPGTYNVWTRVNRAVGRVEDRIAREAQQDGGES